MLTRSLDSIGAFSLAKNVIADLRIPIGKPYRLRGLPAGMVQLIAEFGESGLQASDGWPDRKQWQLTIPKDRTAQLYSTEPLSEIQFELDRLPREKGMLWAAYLYNSTTGNAFAKRLDTRRPQTLQAGVRAGVYDIVVMPAPKWTASWKSDRRGLYWSRNRISVKAR